jgi:signal transduction histidine kinase
MEKQQGSRESRMTTVPPNTLTGNHSSAYLFPPEPLPFPDSWCIVDVVETDGSMRRLGILYSSQGMQEHAERLARSWLPRQDDFLGLPRVLVSRTSEVVPRVPEHLLAEIAHGDENLEHLRALGVESVIMVPLRFRDRLIGAATFVTAEPGRVFDEVSVTVAEAVAAGWENVLGQALDVKRTPAERVEWNELRSRLVEVNERLVLASIREQEYAEEAEDASEAKSRFLATMSHEIRTPINAMIGYMDLLDLSVTDPTPRQQEYFGRMKASSRHLIALIDGILDLSKIESGSLDLREDSVSASESIATAVSVIEPEARSVAVSLDVALPSNGPPIYRGDPDRVRQILMVLLNNAVKFSDTAGHVTVSCGTTGSPDPEASLPGSGPWTFMRVEDTGIGIPPESLKAVFKTFVQLATGNAPRRGGTGLGLSIAMELARRMGGDLTLRSVPGQGSCFTLWLPAPDPAAVR